MYINCKSYFSLLYGTFSTKELVETASEKGVTTMALTNINSTCDIWDFIQHCTEAGIKPVVGAEIRNGDKLMYILLAANLAGVTAIHGFLSVHLTAKKDFPEAVMDYPFFNDCNDGFVVYPLGGKPFERLGVNERIGILHSELTQLPGTGWQQYADKFIIRHPVTVQDKTHYSLHRLLRAIDKNVLLSKLPVESQASADETFAEPSVILERFKQYPDLIVNTYKVLEHCKVQFEFKTDKNKRNFSSSPEDDKVLLAKLARDGFVQRYGVKNKVARERLEKELAIIDQLGFNTYFLISWDIVRYAQYNGFYYVGRGSGGNSIVAYCLRITEVDPVELNLYFERFLNPHRTSPPDFDIDFSWTDRDQVMDYIFSRYGKKYVALLGAYPTFQRDAIVFQLGKVFGLPPDEIKALQRSLQPQDSIQKMILQYGRLMKNFPSNLSLHPCGMLISEKPIQQYATLFMPPKGFPAAQIDMFVAENIGLNKFDILSQRGLGHIRDAQRLIKQNRGVNVNIHDFKRFREDPAIAEQIRTGNTIGCFYIESPSMRQLLKKLRCSDYVTLVAASSIIRPGVTQSGMMREYIYRFHNRDKIKYLHPLFEEHLAETFGVMVFQEDVIKIGHYFAGLDLGEADVLRRAMSGKYRHSNQFQLIRDRFFEGCKQKGHTEELSAEVWRQMESFAGYSFNKAHSASFAVESYMSLYLKTHYPKEFMVAVINNFGGFYSRELYFLELLKCGGDIQPPCVNNSDHFTSIDDDLVYTGFIHISGLQEQLAERVIEERRAHGEYLHLQDFIERTNTGLEQLCLLISVGAFRFTGKSKKRLLWEANFLQKNCQPVLHDAPALFKEEPVEIELPALADDPVDDLYDEMEILGFTLRNPFDLVDDDPAKYVAARDIPKHAGKVITVLAYFITRRHAVTKQDDQMFFGSFVDASLDWIDTVHFPDVAKRYPLHTSGFYRITGKVTEDFGVYSVAVQSMIRVGYKQRKYENLS
ncbi:MAG: DNA polymerase III subunit alpha [Chitinophagaceae bacterium]